VEVSPGVFNLFAANFRKGRIDIFDGNFKPVLNEEFGDDLIETAQAAAAMRPSFSPYNVQALGNDIVVTIAVRGSNGQPVAGNGNGVVLIMTPKGRVLEALHGPSLNVPYGIAEAPADFGRLSHLLLIANNGSGQIAAFDTFSGKFVTFVLDSTGNPLIIDGLRALGFGATGAAGDVSFQNQASGAFNSLNFSAGPAGGTHGLLGNVTPILSDFVIGEQ